MKPTKPLVYYGIALYLGCINFIIFFDNKFLGAVIAASFLIIFLFTIDKRFTALIICFFILGIFSTKVYYSMSYIEKGEKVRVTKISDFYINGQVNGRKISIKGNLNGVHEGDNIFVDGKFEAQKDYNMGIAGVLYADKIKLGKKDIIAHLYDIRREAYKKFEQNLGEDRAALIMSLCFGDTTYLKDEQKNDFQKLGVVHAISVSGFHMAIIYRILENILGFQASIAISFVYLIFTGSQPATVRSFIMIVILKLSKKVFKNYDSLSALSLSAIIILTLRPYYALDVGFILSYLSTLGILLYYNKIRRALYKLPQRLNESLSLTLSAQAFSMPYAGMIFTNMSFGFIPGNLILLPIYSILVVVGNIALIWIKLDFIFKLICRAIYIILTMLDGADYLLINITPPVSYVSYITSICILCIIIAFMLVKKGYHKFKPVPLFILFILFIQHYSFFPEIQYINLGTGDGVIVSYKNERVFIYNTEEDIDTEIKTLNTRFNFTKIIHDKNNRIKLTLNKNCFISILPSKNKNSIDLEVSSFNSSTIITRDSERYMDIDLKKCDIIKLPKRNYYTFNSYSLKNSLDIKGYSVIYKRLYEVYEDGS